MARGGIDQETGIYPAGGTSASLESSTYPNGTLPRRMERIDNGPGARSGPPSRISSRCPDGPTKGPCFSGKGPSKYSPKAERLQLSRLRIGSEALPLLKTPKSRNRLGFQVVCSAWNCQSTSLSSAGISVRFFCCHGFQDTTFSYCSRNPTTRTFPGRRSKGLVWI